MKQIMQDVLKAEERVNAALRQARKRASEIKEAAEKDVSEKMSEAMRQALEITQTTIENARKEAERAKGEKLAQAEQKQQALLNKNVGKVGLLVDGICELILKTEDAKDGE